MGSFNWKGRSYPTPPGFSGLSFRSWCKQLVSEASRDWFSCDAHYAAFRDWGIEQWAELTRLAPQALRAQLDRMAENEAVGSGISMEEWRQIRKQLWSGSNVNLLLKTYGLTRQDWDRVSADYMVRMESDQTGTLASAYRDATTPHGQSQKPETRNTSNVTFAQWVEIREALAAADRRRSNRNKLLATFGLSPAEWTRINTEWSRRFQTNFPAYRRLYDALQPLFRAKFQSSGGQ